LSYINRPIKDIIYLDFSDELLKYHKTNAIVIPKFDGEEEDRILTDVLPFLMYLSSCKGDIRQEI
jgi:import inner membrane translocase subunit TIM50